MANKTLIAVLNDDTMEDATFSGTVSCAKITLDLYVNVSTGSDSNSGLTALLPFETIQKAINTAILLFAQQVVVTINIADGTYDENIILYQNFSSSLAGTSTPRIIGNTGDNTAVLIEPTAGSCVTAVGVGNPWHFKSLQVAAASGNGFVSDFGSKIYLEDISFGTCSGFHCLAQFNSMIEFINDGYDIVGNATVHSYAIRNSLILMQTGHTVTLTGTPAFTYFAFSGDNCSIDYTGTTFTGAATGIQGYTQDKGHILNPRLLPGNAVPQNSDYTSSDVLTGSAVSLTTGTGANITSISIGPGVFDVWFAVSFKGNAATTIAYLASSISSTSATISNVASAIDWQIHYNGVPFTISNDVSSKVGSYRVQLSASTTIYGVAQASFGVNVCSAYGTLSARKISDY